jgi:NAD-dependent SIR2 family protein deacetylase
MVQTPRGNQPLEQDRKPTEHFVDIVARRWAKQPDGAVAKDSIITLNYDLVLDRALQNRGLAAAYCLPDVLPLNTTATQVKLLKLHGSGGWGWCSNCSSVTVFGEAPIRKDQPPPCDRCARLTEVLMVPPTWNKGDYPKELDRVWKAAFEELKELQQVGSRGCIDAGKRSVS